MIGSVEMQDRLYILRVSSNKKLQIKTIKSPHITNTINFTASDLKTFWHFRLGHASTKSTDVIKNKFAFVKYNKFFICEVCHFAKQKRLPFPPIASESKKMFWFDSCWYVDVWEPYSISLINGHKYFLTIVLCQQIEVNLIQEHENVFLLVLKRGQMDILCWIFNQDKCLCLGMLSFMNMFSHIKGLRILAMKLTILTFIIKVLLQKISMFWVSHHKSFLHLVIMLKITVIMTMNEKTNMFWVSHHKLFFHPMVMLIVTMNHTFRFQKKFLPTETKTLIEIMKQHSQFKWVLEQKDHLSI